VRFPESWSSTSLAKQAALGTAPDNYALDRAFALIEGHPRVGYDADADDIGFDLCWRRGPVEASDDVRELAAKLFSKPLETLCPTPFGEPRPYEPKATA
jgi:hypothetical protein